MTGTREEMLKTVQRLKAKLDMAERYLTTAFSIEHGPTEFRSPWDYRTRIDDDRGKLEAALVEAWRRENARGTSGGTAKILRRLLAIDLDGIGDEISIEPTQRDATVTTALVQWLGTNCGIAFLQEAFAAGGCNLTVTPKKK